MSDPSPATDRPTPPVALTIVVTTHGEGRLLRPTIHSIARAIDAVTTLDESVELLLVCDRVDDRTRHEVHHWLSRDGLSFAVRSLDVDLGESGAARNAGAQASLGEYIAFVDGDDLVSSDYFRESLRMLRAAPRRTIVHPHRVISFGARSLVWETLATANGDVDYKSIIRHNPWPSSSVGPAEVYREIPYRSLPPGAGYGPEDWIWNIDTAAAGIAHDVVTDSMFFYRVRERGGVNNRHGASILPRFDFNALRSALPVRVPDASAQGARSFSVRELGRRAYVTARPLVRRITSRLTPEERERIYRGARRVHHTVLRIPTEDSRAAAHIQNALREATEIEPAISWTAHHYDKLARWHTDDDGYADALEYVLDAIGDRSDAIVAVPWVGIGGADLVSRNYATAIQSSARFRGKTTLLATHLPERTVHELIPEGVNFVQVPNTLDKMWPDLQRRFIAQIVVMTRPELLVSVNCFHLANALQLYGRQIADGTDVFATLFAFDRIEPGYPVNPITDDSQRAYLDDIAGIITDNSNTAALVEEILAVEPPVLQVHRQPALDTVPALARDTQAYNDVRFTREDPLRVIWPHRIDTEKRPDTVAAIARMIQERNLPVQIDVWGSPVLSSDAKQRMRDLADAGVHYRGPYSGGLTALPIGEYHALLLTSQSEGLPLVLVQALLCGLPVVASGVGGVPDIIVDGRTGLLTEGPDDIEGFVTSLERLMESIELRRSLIEEGYAFAASQHSWEAFQTTVNETLIGGRPSVRA